MILRCVLCALSMSEVLVCYCIFAVSPNNNFDKCYDICLLSHNRYRTCLQSCCACSSFAWLSSRSSTGNLIVSSNWMWIWLYVLGILNWQTYKITGSNPNLRNRAYLDGIPPKRSSIPILVSTFNPRYPWSVRNLSTRQVTFHEFTVTLQALPWFER